MIWKKWESKLLIWLFKRVDSTIDKMSKVFPANIQRNKKRRYNITATSRHCSDDFTTLLRRCVLVGWDYFFKSRLIWVCTTWSGFLLKVGTKIILFYSGHQTLIGLSGWWFPFINAILAVWNNSLAAEVGTPGAAKRLGWFSCINRSICILHNPHFHILWHKPPLPERGHLAGVVLLCVIDSLLRLKRVNLTYTCIACFYFVK